jgi:hypothetical protein
LLRSKEDAIPAKECAANLCDLFQTSRLNEGKSLTASIAGCYRNRRALANRHTKGADADKTVGNRLLLGQTVSGDQRWVPGQGLVQSVYKLSATDAATAPRIICESS